MQVKYRDSAFFTNWREDGGDREEITALAYYPDDPGIPQQQVNEKRLLDDGTVNPKYEDIVRQLSNEVILKNTKTRKAQKEKQERDTQLLREEKRKSSELEKLFSTKLQVFEIDEVKNSKNRKLRSLIRRSKNQPELYAYTTILLGLEKGIFKDESEQD